MVSEAKLAANRRNALKGGVKTREGKLKSRRNALKHGYRAEVVLPEEMQAESDAMFKKLVDEIRPEGTIETKMVRRMAAEIVKLDRLEKEENASLARRIRQAGETFDDHQRQRVAAYSKLLAQRPVIAVRGLLSFTAGCNWLLDEWGKLRDALDAGSWTPDHALHARNLLGDQSPGDNPSAIAATIADELATIESERDAAWEELDAPLRQEAEDCALLDTSKEGQIRSRYEGQASRQWHKVVDQFCKGRQGWFEPKTGDRSWSVPNEPTDEVLRSPDVVTTETPTPSPRRGEGDRAPNEPNAETLTPVQVASEEALPPAPPRGEGCPHEEDVLPQPEPAPDASQNFTAGGVHPSPRPSPRGGEGDRSPNEPNAESIRMQGFVVEHGSIRREVYSAADRPLPPLVIDGIRVR